MKAWRKPVLRILPIHRPARVCDQFVSHVVHWNCDTSMHNARAAVVSESQRPRRQRRYAAANICEIERTRKPEPAPVPADRSQPRPPDNLSGGSQPAYVTLNNVPGIPGGPLDKLGSPFRLFRETQRQRKQAEMEEVERWRAEARRVLADPAAARKNGTGRASSWRNDRMEQGLR